MDQVSADKCLEDILTNYSRLGIVSFFGGEATLNFEIIKYIVRRLNDARVEIHTYELFTNGANVTDEMIDFLIENNFKVKISIDGPDYIHDKLRLNCHHSKVVKVIERMARSSIKEKIELHCTYTRLHDELIGYKELEKYFEKFGLKYCISNVISSDKELTVDYNEDYITIAKMKIDDSYERIYKASNNIDISGYVINVLDALINKVYREKFCYDVYEGYLSVYDYDAKKIPCLGMMDVGIFDRDVIEEVNKKSNIVCEQCWARGVCSDCIADILTEKKVRPYLNGDCDKKKLYAYALETIVRILEENPEKFNKIVENFQYQF